MREARDVDVVVGPLRRRCINSNTAEMTQIQPQAEENGQNASDSMGLTKSLEDFAGLELALRDELHLLLRGPGPSRPRE